jgi:hypothetical protein
MAVFPSSITLEVGLQPHGSFRELLINEDFVQGVWPMSDLNTSSSRVRDISGYRRDGVIASGGSDPTRGNATDLPEGALAFGAGASTWIEVSADPADLSLAGGSVDIIFLINTTTNDGTTRYIVHKTDAGQTVGFFVALLNGQIQFFASDGVDGFIFERGAIADGAWHLVHCCYEPEEERARIFIDGVQIGLEVSSVTFELPERPESLYLLGKPAGNRFIGFVSYVMVGREGNPALSVQLQTARIWTSLVSDTRSTDPITWGKGIPSTSVLDNVASPGQMTFALDNSHLNSAGLVGYYSPGHDNARSGWRTDIPVRFGFTYLGVTVYKWRGFINDIVPAPGVHLSRQVNVTCGDWIGLASRALLPAIPVGVNERSDVSFKTVLDAIDTWPPPDVSIGVGSSVFPFTRESSSGGEPVMTELARVTQSERGFCYIKGGTVHGGVLVFEGRGRRQSIQGIGDGAWDDADTVGMTGGQLQQGLINVVRVLVTPRSVDTSATTVLYRLEVSQQSQAIGAGETVVLEGSYRDPSEKAVRVGGAEMVTPVAGTDYAFWSNSNGTGVDLTSALTVVADLGGSGFRVTLVNTAAVSGFLYLDATTAFQIRGKGVYHYTPISILREDRDSVRRHGARTVQIDMEYESDRGVGEGVADFIINTQRSRRLVPTTLTIIGNRDSIQMVYARDREPGDFVKINETVTGVAMFNGDGSANRYFINQENGSVMWGRQGAIVTVVYTLTPTAGAQAGRLDVDVLDAFVIGF